VRAADPDAVAYYKREQKVPEALPFSADLVAVSKYTVAFPLQQPICQKLADGCNDVKRFPAAELAPAIPQQRCRCGLLYHKRDLVRASTCNIYFSVGSIRRDVFALDCPSKQPGCRILYDGSEHALWVCTPTIAFSVAVFAECLEQVSGRSVLVSHFIQFCRCASSAARCRDTTSAAR
jgi:hypothetical protein